MVSVWFLGFLGVIVYRVFNAGMNTKSLFYNADDARYRAGQLDVDRVIFYIVKSVVSSLFWMFVFPGYGIFVLGRKYRKEVK